MILSYILRFIKGFVRFELSGKDISEFLNCLMETSIYTWNISRIDDKFYANISIKDYLSLHKLSHGYNIKFRVQYKYGLPFIINKYKKRFGILIGVLFFICFLVIMSQFIWSIEIQGNNRVDVDKLAKFIASRDVAPGKFRKNVDVRLIERDVLLNFKEISWIAINIEGSKATVNINEVTVPPDNLDNGAPCNIIAAKKGVIKRVEAYNGQNVVNIGDFVQKGQLLVSGIMEDKALNSTFVHARAKAVAEVEETIRYYQSVVEKNLIYKDIKTNYYMQIFDKRMPLNFSLKKSVIGKDFCNIIYPKIYNISLPFNIIKCSNKQPVVRYIKLSPNQVKCKMLKRINRYESKMMSNDIKIISKQVLKNVLTDKNYIIEIKYITEQDIAQPQHIMFG